MHACRHELTCPGFFCQTIASYVHVHVNAKRVLPTPPSFILPSLPHVAVGESLRQHYSEQAEDDRRRAIRSTEEVVRREEAQRREEELAAAQDRWRKERQELFKEAHQVYIHV